MIRDNELNIIIKDNKDISMIEKRQVNNFIFIYFKINIFLNIYVNNK